MHVKRITMPLPTQCGVCGEHLWLTMDQVSSLQLLLKRIMCYDVAPLGGWVGVGSEGEREGKGWSLSDR